MSLPDAPGPAQESPPSAASLADRPPSYAVPWTFWLWVAVIVAAYLLPRALRPADALRESPSAGAPAITTENFQRAAQAEINARLVFSPTLQQVPGGTARYARELLASYRALARDAKSPNMARRALIVAASRSEEGRADAALFELLEANLRAQKVPAGEVAAEMALWRSVYGIQPPIRGPDALENASRRIRGFRIGFLEDRALQDLYTRAGNEVQADAARARLESAASRKMSRLGLAGGLLFVAGLSGVVLLIVFLVNAARGNWPAVHRVATQEQRFAWGDLLDCFAFYLALVRGVGFGVGFFNLRALSASPLAPMTAVYVGTGLGAVVYLWAKARQRGLTLADIGLRAPGGLLANVGYGVAAYCAALPLVVGVGALARLVFKGGLGGPTTTPNPVLPLLAGESDPTGRIVIFLLVALAAPLLEEIFFRGALYAGLRTRYRWVAAAAISGALFAVVHPISDWPQIFALGFALATMREMRQSLIPGMVAHFLQNSMAFTMMSLIFGP